MRDSFKPYITQNAFTFTPGDSFLVRPDIDLRPSQVSVRPFPYTISTAMQRNKAMTHHYVGINIRKFGIFALMIGTLLMEK